MLPMIERPSAREIAACGDAAVMENSDRSASAGDLDRVRGLTHVAIRQALDGARSGIRRDDALAECLRAVCSEARDIGLHVEDIIVMIKQSWRAVESQALNRREDESTLGDVVTRCITEYYRDGNDGLRG